LVEVRNPSFKAAHLDQKPENDPNQDHESERQKRGQGEHNYFCELRLLGAESNTSHVWIDPSFLTECQFASGQLVQAA
jgi:hypothetical protein